MSTRHQSGGPKFKLGKVLLVIVGVGYPLFKSLVALDGINSRWVVCHVTHAETGKRDRFGASVWRVAIETTDCGRIVYQQAATEDKVEYLAESFTPGVYEFKFGLASQLAADGWVPMLTPSAKDYQALVE